MPWVLKTNSVHKHEDNPDSRCINIDEYPYGYQNYQREQPPQIRVPNSIGNERTKPSFFNVATISQYMQNNYPSINYNVPYQGEESSIARRSDYLPDNFIDEDPLLEELGIDFEHIMHNMLAALFPFKRHKLSILQKTDLAGPLLLCLILGICLVFGGKVHFNYIYVVGVISTLSMFTLLNLMSELGVSLAHTVSVLGYCLLPMIFLSIISLFPVERNFLLLCSIFTVSWCSLSASKLFVLILKLHHQQMLVAYPCALIYGVFALLAIF